MRYAVVIVLIQTFLFQVVKDGLRYSSPFVLMGMRLLIASFFMFGIARRFRPIINKDTILLSLFMCAATAFWAYGLEYVSPADSAVLTYTMPLFSIPISSVILSEKPTSSEWAGAVVGFLGVLIYSLSFTNHSFTLFGGVLTLVNAFFFAMFTVYFRKLRKQEPIMTLATQFLFTALVFLVLAPLDYKLVATPNFLFDLAYLSIPGAAVFFFLWSALARLRKIGKTTTLLYLVPVAATFVQIVQTSIMPDIVSLSGLALMILGLYLSNGTIPLPRNANRLGYLISRFSRHHA
jgi:drug/metabolite transporter (DMT)-like permease